MTESSSSEPTGPDGQDSADRQDAPGSDVRGALATGDGHARTGAGAVGGDARSGGARDESEHSGDAKRTEGHQGDVDSGADSEPDPEGYGPLSEGRGGQQFG
ncbi:MAG: hypothetical protein JWN61_813 [Pseudonocardiales bacterium]|nr:hypothetical protein [Pseudonocardiales bacterium]